MTQIVNLMLGIFVIVLLSAAGLMVLQREHNELKATEESVPTVEDQASQTDSAAEPPAGATDAAQEGEDKAAVSTEEEEEPSVDLDGKPSEVDEGMPPPAAMPLDGETAPAQDSASIPDEAADSSDGLTIEEGEPPASEEIETPATVDESGDPPVLQDTMPVEGETGADQPQDMATDEQPKGDETTNEEPATP